MSREQAPRILLHTIWQVERNSPLLTEEARNRLAPYITRYAQTLGVVVLAVGGTDDHLHILHGLLPSRPLDKTLEEIQRATVRFLRDSMQLTGFVWSEEGDPESLRPTDSESLIGYIRENAVRHATQTTVLEWEGSSFATEDSPEDPAAILPEWLKQAAQGMKD